MIILPVERITKKSICGIPKLPNADSLKKIKTYRVASRQENV